MQPVRIRTRHPEARFGLFVLLVAVSLTLAGCTEVTFVDTYDEETVRSTTELIKKNEAFFVRIEKLLETAPEEAKYDRQAGFYDEVKVDLAVMRTRKASLPNSELTVMLIDQVQAIFGDLEKWHKAGLNKQLAAEAHRITRVAIEAVLKAENVKPRLTSPRVTTTWQRRTWDAVWQFYREKRQEPWFLPIAALGSLLTAYISGMTALLVLAWRGGSNIFSRSWLIASATKPLLVAPRFGRWALFLGYRRRLMRLRAIKAASTDFFGLPAEDPTGSMVLPDPTGESLHERIAETLGPQQPVVVVGKGGAGKSTLLARSAFLALKGQLAVSLRGFSPLLIPASYYNGNLVKTIADTLRERDGVAVDDKIIQVQLQTGRFLILFDGLTEVETDKQQSLQEILRTAQHADFQGCRFLVATRPLEGIPLEVPSFHLRPLTSDVISALLPRYRLGRERESQVRRQLESFGEKPIEPLLFAMALAQSGSEQVSTTRAQLYERYFRRLLRAETDETMWSGWRTALETLAEWFLIRTGKRGVGLRHEPLVDLMVGKAGDSPGEGGLVKALQRYYHLPARDELDLLQQLDAAGLLQGGRRRHFAHDTFEEYFAAGYLVSSFEEHEQWPTLDKWTESREQEQAFLDVIDFVREMVDGETRLRVLKLDMPSSWRNCLAEYAGPTDNARAPG